MRFYFQDAGQKIATKCIRVSSTGSTQAVIETLIEKFRPDMKMLYMTEYALYEIHPNGGIKLLTAEMNLRLSSRAKCKCFFFFLFPSRGEVPGRRRETVAGPAELAQGRPRGPFPLETGRREVDSARPAATGRIQLPLQALEAGEAQRQKGEQTAQVEKFRQRRRWRPGRREWQQERDNGREVVHGAAGNEFHALHQ